MSHASQQHGILRPQHGCSQGLQKLREQLKYAVWLPELSEGLLCSHERPTAGQGVAEAMLPPAFGSGQSL